MGQLLVAWPTLVMLATCLSLPAAVQADSRVYLHPRSLFAVDQLRTAQDAQGAQLTVNTTKFTRNQQAVAVTVSKVPSPANGDLLALYTPADSDPRRTAPISWANITLAAPSYLRTASAVLTFNLRNHRANFVFRLIRNGTFFPVAVAQSPQIENAITVEPGQLHLALHASGSSMVVQWVSGSGGPQQLLYWAASGALKAKASTLSSSLTYSADMMCGPPANSFGFISPGFQHRALIPLRGFGPNAQVFYQVGSPDAGWSSSYAFTTPPAAGGTGIAAAPPGMATSGTSSSSTSSSSTGSSSTKALKFLVFNDVGQADPVLFNNTRCPPYCPVGYEWDIDYTLNSTKLVPYLAAEPEVQLGLLVGDLSYANGYAADWDTFGYQFESAFAKWPLMVAPGNHERDWPFTGDAFNNTSVESGGECNVPYTYRFYTPAQQQSATSSSSSSRWGPVRATQQEAGSLIPPGSGRKAATTWDTFKSYYSFSMGPIHVLMLDSESPSNPQTPQGQFVAEDLAKVDRTQYPFVIACMHRMMVAPSDYSQPLVGDIQNMQRLQADYEELFRKFKVNMVIQGHEHAYARTCPWYKGSCVSTNSTMTNITSSRILHGSSDGAGAKLEQTTFSVKSLLQPSAPVYILAGHAGAGFTTSFPAQMPSWVEFATQTRNGYLRISVTGKALLMENISTDDGSIMDAVQLVL